MPDNMVIMIKWSLTATNDIRKDETIIFAESPFLPSVLYLKNVLASVIHSCQHSGRIGILVWTLCMVSPFRTHFTFSLTLSFSECELADFVTGSSSQKIPFVFLPLSGQLVYPR